MRLGLCSGAAPEASFDGLLEAARRRGLSALELREGDAHGVSPGNLGDAEAAAVRADRYGIGITGYRVAAHTDTSRLVRMATALGARLLFDGSADASQRIACATQAAAEGAEVAMVVRGAGALGEARLVMEAGLDLAWDAMPDSEPVGTIAGALLAACGARLKEVRLHGGGPEAQRQEGRGVGEMSGRLALAGYKGTFILTPTTRRYRVAWEGWLGRRGGWGCGSKSAEPGLVGLSRETTRKEVSR